MKQEQAKLHQNTLNAVRITDIGLIHYLTNIKIPNATPEIRFFIPQLVQIPVNMFTNINIHQCVIT